MPLGLGLMMGLGHNVAASGGGGGAAFTPASLTNLAAWYDADQQTEGDGNAVSTFTDRSGNGKHFTNTGGTTPTLRHASINGKKTLEWDSIDQLTCAGGLLNGATAGYFFAVIKLNADPPTTGGGAAILDAFSTDGWAPTIRSRTEPFFLVSVVTPASRGRSYAKPHINPQ
jgi:hypothetical protein